MIYNFPLVFLDIGRGAGFVPSIRKGASQVRLAMS